MAQWSDIWTYAGFTRREKEVAVKASLFTLPSPAKKNNGKKAHYPHLQKSEVNFK